jgi:hypothetical protein
LRGQSGFFGRIPSRDRWKGGILALIRRVSRCRI